MSTKTGELRAILIDCIEKVRQGKMTGNDAKAVAMLAGQITLSLQVEVNVRRDEILAGKGEIGHLALGLTVPAVADEVTEGHTIQHRLDIEDAEAAVSPFNWRATAGQQP